MHTKPESLSAHAEIRTAEPIEPTRGTTIGRFLVLEPRGAGGMGVVYAAHDPELDRKVALKLLRPQTGAEGPGDQARLMREARALAKLAHPNVVAVYDVGKHGDRVWIAMEFLAGQTLTAWAQERPRRWPELLAVLTDVARGMAAAQGAGIVHRDIKPDNVMFGQDGRVRVMDFGLAHGRAAAVTEPELPSTLGSRHTTAPLALQLTAQGAVQGTPAYMAPEQWRGRDTGPAADQFGWSVMAWELLYGERPFAGESNIAIKDAVLAGQRRPPPRGRSVPSWLRRVLERGLATDPAQRWPSMAALLSALGRGKTRARVRVAATALASVAAIAAGAWAYRGWDRAQRVATCEATGAVIEQTWDDGARQRLRGAFLATGVSYAATSAEKVMPWLDKQASEWKQARTEVCLNATVHQTWDEDLVDRATWCLEDRQMEFESLVDEFGRADPTTVQKAVTAAAGLRLVGGCLNRDMLQGQPIPPIEAREPLRAMRAMRARSFSLALLGTYSQALELAVQARVQSTALGWAPATAASRKLEGSLLEELGEYKKAEAALRDAYFESARVGAWDVAVDAASTLAYCVGYRLAQHEEGIEWARHADMALAHAEDSQGLQAARSAIRLAAVHTATGSYVEARNLLERALATKERSLGSDHPDIAHTLSNLGALYQETASYAEAQVTLQRALDVAEQALGPDHPDLSRPLHNLASLYDSLGESSEIFELLERALALKTAALGPDHPDVGNTLRGLARIQMEYGEFIAAQHLFEHALDTLEPALGPNHPKVAIVLEGLGNLHRRTGAPFEAFGFHRHALAIRLKSLKPGHQHIAMSLNNIANIYDDIGDHAKAIDLYGQALQMKGQWFGQNHPEFAYALRNLASVHLAINEPQLALSLLARAIAIYDQHIGNQPGELYARFEFAVALIATGGDQARALTEARIARDGFREAGSSDAKELAEVEQWLAEHDNAQ